MKLLICYLVITGAQVREVSPTHLWLGVDPVQDNVEEELLRSPGFKEQGEGMMLCLALPCHLISFLPSFTESLPCLAII